MDLSVFESSCYLPICLLHTVGVSHCPFLLLNAIQGSCEYQFFDVFGLSLPEIESESTRPLIGLFIIYSFYVIVMLEVC